MNQWLPLIEFSNKYSVSISTLRRRIKDKSIEFKLEDGKYFIFDEIVNKNSSGRKPIQLEAKQPAESQNLDGIKNNGLAQALVDEIKRAFTQILQEKEDIVKSMKVRANPSRREASVRLNTIGNINSDLNYCVENQNVSLRLKQNIGSQSNIQINMDSKDQSGSLQWNLSW